MQKIWTGPISYICTAAILSFAVTGPVTQGSSVHSASTRTGLPASTRSAQPFDDDYSQPINGVTLHFRVRGANKANPYLLLLHGGPGAGSLAFYPWGESLEADLNVV